MPVGTPEPGVVIGQVRVVGSARTMTNVGFAPPLGGSGARLPVTDRVTQVSVQAAMTGYRLTLVPEGAPTTAGLAQ